MLLVALQHIPGPIAVAPGQQFYEPNDEQRAVLIRTGFARPAQESKTVAVAQPAAGAGSVGSTLNWTGATVVVIAGGPSLTLEQCADVERWHATPATGPARKVIAINTSFRRALFADVLYACDGGWWDAYIDEVRASNAFRVDQLWTQDANAAKKYGLQYIASTNARGLSRKPGLIGQGMNSAFQTMNLAFLWGAKRFVLLGVDCKGGHWHGNHPGTLNKVLPHKRWQEHFADLARDLAAEGVSVVNCSPDTALRAFPRASLSEELAR